MKNTKMLTERELEILESNGFIDRSQSKQGYCELLPPFLWLMHLTGVDLKGERIKA